MRPWRRTINFKGELFASTFTFGLSSLIKLASSLILTRLLNPEAYGIVAVLFSVAFIVELLSDVGTVGLLIRHERGKESKFIHTVWTIRLIRGFGNFCLLYFTAPLIAEIYDMPVLIDALRTFSFAFLFQCLDSMAFVLAQRDQRARIFNYIDLCVSVLQTVLVIWLAGILNDHFAFIYGSLFQSATMALISHSFYRHIGVSIAFDREAVRAQFDFAKFVLPSSLLTIALSQYDRIVLLKLFDLRLLGIYGIAGNVAGPINGLIMRNSRVVLYPRCAEYFRTNRETAVVRYYTENTRLLAIGTLLPAALAGFSQSIVALLYDPRYADAGIILMCFSLGAVCFAFQNASENLLVASGRTRVILGANIVRILTIVPATLIGYALFGFSGFLWFGLASGLAPLLYFYWEQRRWKLLDLKAESHRFAAGLVTFAVCLAISQAILPFIPADSMRQVFNLVYGMR